MEMQIGCCCETIPVSINRPLYGGTPLNGDSSVAGYTSEWEPSPPIYRLESTGYHQSSPPYWTLYGVQFTASHVVSGSLGGLYEYAAKLRPFRWQFGGASFSHYAVSGVCCEKFTSTVENRFTGPSEFNHASPVVTSAVSCRPWIYAPRVGYTWKNPSVVSAKFMRVIINGNDATGVVPVTFGALSTCSAQLLSSVNMTNATVAVDLWMEMSLSVPRTNGHPDDMVPGTNLLSAEPRYGCLVSTNTYSYFNSGVAIHVGTGSYSGGNARQLANRRWRLTFAANGPGGVADLVLEEQDGWTFVRINNTITMTHAATGDIVVLEYGREVPRILITRQAATALANYTKTCIYTPRSASEYEPLWRYLNALNTPIGRRGTVSKTAGATFDGEGRVFTDGRIYPPPGSGEPYTEPTGIVYGSFPPDIEMIPA